MVQEADEVFDVQRRWSNDLETEASWLAASVDFDPLADVAIGATDQMAERCQRDVVDADTYRRHHFLPMKQIYDGKTDENWTNADKLASVDWSSNYVNPNDAFQKRMEFMHRFARTGFFVEEYGKEGRYEGEFLKGMRHGKGVHEFREEIYNGEWKFDQRHGQGNVTLPDKSSIKGEWQKGKVHGFATRFDPNGTVVYDGEFQQGRRHGLGRQVFDSGDVYEGSWRNGRFHGRGVYYYANRDVLYGMWSEGIYDGVAVFHRADGAISRRVYKDGCLVSMQEFEYASQKSGKALIRDGAVETKHRLFPKELFMLSCA